MKLCDTIHGSQEAGRLPLLTSVTCLPLLGLALPEAQMIFTDWEHDLPYPSAKQQSPQSWVRGPYLQPSGPVTALICSLMLRRSPFPPLVPSTLLTDHSFTLPSRTHPTAFAILLQVGFHYFF